MITERIARFLLGRRPTDKHWDKRLSWSQKVSRLGLRMRDPEWRRYGRLLFAGKLLGIGVVIGGVLLVPEVIGWTALAADVELKGNDIVNPLNTLWVLLAAFLVFAMQVGFTMLEAGFCRSRETVNVLMECIVDTCLCGLLFYAIGFAFMFWPRIELNRLVPGAGSGFSASVSAFMHTGEQEAALPAASLTVAHFPGHVLR